MGLSNEQLLIAEVKTRSPFGWEAPGTWQRRFDLAKQYGGWVSVHTDERWGGSFDLLAHARGETDLPLLAKGLHGSDELVRQAFDRGADYALVVGRVPTADDIELERCLIEPVAIGQFEEFAARGVQRMVHNARDVFSGQPQHFSFEEARALWDGWLCQASLIQTVEDVRPDAQAVLVGTHLPEFIQSMP